MKKLFSIAISLSLLFQSGFAAVEMVMAQEEEVTASEETVLPEEQSSEEAREPTVPQIDDGEKEEARTVDFACRYDATVPGLHFDPDGHQPFSGQARAQELYRFRSLRSRRGGDCKKGEE